MPYRWPVATPDDLLDVYQPMASHPSNAPLRTLKKRRLVSQGWQLPLKGRLGLRGRLSVYNALNLDAVRLARRGDRLAETYANAASNLEERLSGLVREHAEQLTAGPSPASDLLYLRMARLIAEASRELPPIPGVERTYGTLTSKSESHARISREESAPFDIPVALTSRAGAQLGDAVYVIRETWRGDVLIRVEHAIDETEPEREGVDVEGELSDFMTHQIETASGPGFMAALMKGTEAQAPWEPSVLFPAG